MAFSIELRDPRHGWVNVHLSLGAQRFEFPVSHVLNDPVRELAELAISIAKNDGGDRRVNFWLEPQGYELRSAARSGWLTLTLSYSHEATPNLTRPILVVEDIVERVETAGQILKCLRGARTQFSAAQLADANSWAHAFPQTVVAELEERVGGV